MNNKQKEKTARAFFMFRFSLSFLRGEVCRGLDCQRMHATSKLQT